MRRNASIARRDHIADFTALDNIDLSSVAGLTFIGDQEFSGNAGQTRYEFEDYTTAIEIDSDGDSALEYRIVIDNAPVGLKETTAGSGIW